MKKKFFIRKALSMLIALVVLRTSIPVSAMATSATTTFIQQNVLQVNANSSNDYISGSWYSLSNGSSNIRDAGCGIVSLVSAVYNLGGTIEKKDIGSVIDEVFDWAYSKGYWTASAGTYWSMFINSDEQFGAKYGFSVSKQYGSKNSESTSLTSMVNHLKNDNGTVVVHVYGHFMVVADYKVENGKEMLRVFDPAPGAGSNYNSINRRNVTHAAGDWFELSVLQRDGGTKGSKGSTENIEVDAYWLISPTSTVSSTVSNSTNPDSYPECERDLVYKTSAKTGDDVKWVQCILKHLGYSIDIDGSYGPSSRDTIKQFQTAYGLTVDGMCGPATRAKLKEVWASKGHTWNSGTVITAATHTTTGIRNHQCNYCEATKNEAIAKIAGCTYGAWQNINATHHQRTCACGATETFEHSWNGGVVTQQPTCTTAGVMTYTCTGCNATKTATISANGHGFGVWQSINATHHQRTCACGATETFEHSWNGGVVTQQPTCTTAGVMTYTCTGCNATKTATISANGHGFGVWQSINATHHQRTCACGATETFEHSWNGGVVSKNATHTEQGVKTFTCTGCGAIKTENIPAITTHSYGEWVTYDENHHQRTCVCGSYELSAHDWDNGTITVPASYTQEGLRTYECRYCNGSKTETIPKLVAPENAPHISIGDYEVAAGGTVRVQVSLNNNPGIASLILKIAYDNSLLTLTEVQYNTSMGGQTIVPADYNSPLTLYWINAFENMTEDAIFATLTFKVKESATAGALTDIAVSYNTNDIYNLNEENVNFVVQNGSIKVIDYELGDINGDGAVNNKDVTRLMQFFAGWEVEVNEIALDVNGDGEVNNKDVTRLMQFLAGWNVEIH